MASSLKMSSSILFPNPNKFNQKSCFIRNQQVHIFLRRSISSSSSLSHCLSFNNHQLIPKLIRVSALSTDDLPSKKKNDYPRFSDSIRLIVALFAIGLSISKLSIQGVQVSNVGPLFFAAISDHHQHQQRVNVVGMHKFYNTYNSIVVIRVVLSWFPNIPWDFCVLSVLKKMTDPYLDLFRIKSPQFPSSVVHLMLAHTSPLLFQVVLLIGPYKLCNVICITKFSTCLTLSPAAM